MDANRIQEQAKELVQKLVSADPADAEDAVSQYFKPDASLRTTHISVRGSRQIKKMLRLASVGREKAGEIIEKPKYDQKSQTIRYSSSIKYASPTLPAYIPLAEQFSGYKTSVPWDFVAHLASDNSKGQKLYVKKFEGKRRNPRAIDRMVPTFITIPIVTFLCLTMVAFADFFKAHKGEGPVKFILAGLEEIVNTVWGTLLTETGKRQEQAGKWRDEKVPQIKEYIQQASTQAFDAASKVQADLETRAKNAGIPIDDYKQRAAQAVTDLTGNVEARAKAAGIPVEEYRKQAEAAIEELKRRAGEVGDFLEGKAGEVKEQAQKKGGEVKKQAEGAAQTAQKKAGEAKEQAQGVAQDAQKKVEDASKDAQQGKRTRENSNQVGQDQSNAHITVTGEEAGRLDEEHAKKIREEFEKTPHTPLGGHDPTAENAPSFALAAAV